MSYYTYFDGAIQFNKPLNNDLADFIKKFAATRHFQRDTETLMQELDENNINIKDILPPVPGINDFGENCKFFAIPNHDSKWNNTWLDSVMDFNSPPEDCPSLWCDIYLSKTHDKLYLRNGTNYRYVSWLEWLIKYFFAPAGYILNGSVCYNGEDRDDRGVIVVENNSISVQ